MGSILLQSTTMLSGTLRPHITHQHTSQISSGTRARCLALSALTTTQAPLSYWTGTSVCTLILSSLPAVAIWLWDHSTSIFTQRTPSKQGGTTLFAERIMPFLEVRVTWQLA